MIKSKQKKTPAARRTDAWGIDPGYEDAFGQWHRAPAKTIESIRRAMSPGGAALGGDDARPPAARNNPLVVREGDALPLPQPAVLRLEDGSTLTAGAALPPDLPAGYHRLRFAEEDEPRRLIVSPGECALPPAPRSWGWAVQLYAARSCRSWGIGDLTDLAYLARWSANDLGAGMLLVNPLSAACPIQPQQASPYYPSSRSFFNPLWIDVEAVAGSGSRRLLPEIETAARAGRALNAERLIDRDRIFALKMAALGKLWETWPGDPAFDKFSRDRGHELATFAVFCALAEEHNSGWHSWPDAYRHPARPEVARFAAQNERRVQFHKWLQWLLDRQLAEAAEHLAITQDLPIGVDPDGADAWAWQDVLATGASVGAPPDEFNTQGQNWGLPPFIPHRLRAAGYEPFIQTIRAVLRHGGGLRIDHVMGLFRLFWIPAGRPARDGAYVRYPADELLAIVALESQRAGAFVVGEDLGTVEADVREKLASCHVLSYRLLWFEKDDPETYPQRALAAVTTHDLPTVAGLWTGSDLARQHELHLQPNEESTAEIHNRLTHAAGLDPESPAPEVIAGAYSLLARAPSCILTAALEDAVAVEERPNIPATMSEQNPNWSLALPCPLEDLAQRPLPARIAAALRRAPEGVNS